jgi:hypothetical protein
MRVSDSVWHKTAFPEDRRKRRGAGRLLDVAFPELPNSFRYLVGSHEEVSEEVSRYKRNGFQLFILHLPPSREELGHIQAVFEYANRGVAS